jgi:membrane protease subunit (stomatin/prohibitin family)
MARIFDVIQVPSMGSKDMVRRVPEEGMGDFRLGSQVIVGPGQAAVFVRDGKALDTFDSGRHTITTANVPLLGKLIGAAFGGETPFKAEVYFVNITEFPKMGWGTRNPVPIRHPGIGVGASLIVANGIFRMKVANPQLFVGEFAARQGLYTTDEIHDTLRTYVVSALKDIVGELGLKGKSAFDLPAMIDEVGAAVQAKVNDEFDSMGLRLIDFKVEDLNPKEESAETLAKMGLIDMGELQKYQFAMSMRDMAQQDAGAGGGAMGLGAGAGMGMGMAQMMAQQMMQGGQQPPQAAPAAAATMACPKCGQQTAVGGKFCSHCGEKIEAAAGGFCSNCGAQLAPGAKFCPQCGQKLG